MWRMLVLGLALFVAPVPAGAEDPHILFLERGSFSGIAFDDNDKTRQWSFRLYDFKFDSDIHFRAQMEWPSLSAIHEVDGRMRTDNYGIEWQETRFLKQGNAILGCWYFTHVKENSSSEGVFVCDKRGGTFRATWR